MAGFLYTIFEPSVLINWKDRLKHDEILFFAGQIEVCPITHRPHLQLYVEFKKKARASRLNFIFGLGREFKPHFEQRRGDPTQARDYCTKEDTRAPGEEPEIWGSLPAGQGTA